MLVPVWTENFHEMELSFFLLHLESLVADRKSLLSTKKNLDRDEEAAQMSETLTPDDDDYLHINAVYSTPIEIEVNLCRNDFWSSKKSHVYGACYSRAESLFMNLLHDTYGDTYNAKNSAESAIIRRLRCTIKLSDLELTDGANMPDSHAYSNIMDAYFISLHHSIISCDNDEDEAYNGVDDSSGKRPRSSKESSSGQSSHDSTSERGAKLGGPQGRAAASSSSSSAAGGAGGGGGKDDDEDDDDDDDPGRKKFSKYVDIHCCIKY